MIVIVIVTVTVTFAQRKTLSTAQTTNYTIGLQINEKSAKTNERDKIVESVIKQSSDVCGGKMCKKVSFKIGVKQYCGDRQWQR